MHIVVLVATKVTYAPAWVYESGRGQNLHDAISVAFFHVQLNLELLSYVL